ncbi:MAG TPA: ATP-binding protein [Vicinamibacteria bacterium]|nr:ATP-binding protein [Vicinamibacteria bacterium]
MVIRRRQLLAQVRTALRRSPVVCIVGPRQCGKTTLARQLLPARGRNYFDLEDPVALERLQEPITALSALTGLVVIDEVQRRPELFPALRVLVDRRPSPARFLILGSAAPGLLKQSSESLAGRIEVVRMTGLAMSDVSQKALPRHWLRGGFPRSFLARSELDSLAWRREFVATFLERDLPQLAAVVPASATTLLRFWRMLAHYHGGVWKATDFAGSLGVDAKTVRRYLDTFTDLFMVRQLPPWHENVDKRQVKAPKVYIRDSGLLHYLLGGVTGEEDLLSHPKCGASWEGYAIEEVLKAVEPDEACFWAVHSGPELDLLLLVGGRKYGLEIKRSDAPRLEASMRAAIETLKLDHMLVLYPGARRYALSNSVTVVPLAEVKESRRLLRGSA